MCFISVWRNVVVQLRQVAYTYIFPEIRVPDPEPS